MSKRNPKPRLIVSEGGRIVHVGWVDYFGHSRPECGQPGLYRTVSEMIVTCKRCLRKTGGNK